MNLHNSELKRLKYTGPFRRCEINNKYFPEGQQDGKRKLMEWFLNNVIEEKARTKVSSLPYERSEERKGYRNGSRTLKTTDGKLELEKPQIMEFSFIAQVFERYSNVENALNSVILESSYIVFPQEMS